MTNKNLKYVICVVAVAIIIVICGLTIIGNFEKPKPTLAPNGIRILIDPGHGGSDPGAISQNGTRECDINLAVANCLKDYLVDRGFEVMMTRTENEVLMNDDRKRIMKETECDAVISIHMNKFSDERVRGSEVFYFAENEESKKLAESVQEAIKNVLNPQNKRTVKGTTSLFAVKMSSSPSVLVECGYLSNPEEEKLLNTVQYQRRIAFSICCGIQSYFSA